MLAKKIIPSLLLIAITIAVCFAFTKQAEQQKTTFRDLNKNGKMDVYEDAKQSTEARITDLIKQMTIEEKAGMMFINGAKVNDDGSIEDLPAKGMFAFVPNALPLIRDKR